MCGIVAATADRNVVPILLAGLHALEYRGYDSAGFCVWDDNELKRLRAVGKVAALDELQEEHDLRGQLGIAHTRWATHGVPATRNAHPIMARDRVAVVHNGIIENFEPLKASLKADGVVFDSDTDTEVIAYLVARELDGGADLLGAVQATIKHLEGAFALAVICLDEPQRLIGARLGSPLVVGLGFEENFLASDGHALLPVTNRFIYLSEGDIVDVRRKELQVYDASGTPTAREVKTSDLSSDAISRGEYRHFMLKEIFEQPRAVAETLEGRLSGSPLRPRLGQRIESLLADCEAVHIVACGTSYHAGLVAKFWLEGLAKVSCHVEIASEYRYRHVVVPEKCLFLTISQSGETSDTLAALQIAKTRGYIATLALCNRPESSLVRESDAALMTRAGPEIGVASTKAFTTQLVGLALISLGVMAARGGDKKILDDCCEDLSQVSQALESALTLTTEIEKLAERFGPKNHALFLGRGIQFPIALEGALKLKEISYIHAEAYPAGELKHGPLALVDDDMPVIAVAPNDELLEKLKSNISVVASRGGELYVIADADSADRLKMDDVHLLTVPYESDFLSPILMTVPLQLLSYHVAVIKGTDIDQPRNLAKSVTTE